MEEITIKINYNKIQTAFQIAAEKMFESSYSNPVKDLLEKAFKEKEGVLKSIVDGIISEALTSPEFKDKITSAVINNLVNAALRK